MAATAGVATPFQPYRIRITGSGTQPTLRMAEKAGQTFLLGTPVQIDVAGATGFIIANPTITNPATAIILGMAQENASNLASSGVPQTQNLSQKVPNQPNAVIAPIGAPINDGTVGIYLVDDDQTFQGIVGNSNTAANAVLAQAMVGAIFGLTKDATTGFWYVDNFITTAGTGACVEVLSLIDPVGTLNGRVEFRVTQAAQQGNL